jgi:Aminotransferase class I and II
VLGDPSDAVAAAERALEQGVFAQAIRPPSVPEDTSRLRLTVMASHTKSELRRAAKVLAWAVGTGIGRERIETVQRPATRRVYDGLADAA